VRSGDAGVKVLASGGAWVVTGGGDSRVDLEKGGDVERCSDVPRVESGECGTAELYTLLERRSQSEATVSDCGAAAGEARSVGGGPVRRAYVGLLLTTV